MRWVAQRASAGVLAVCVVVHLATILYASRRGLTGAAMLQRAHASALWPAFYAVFVIAAAIHAPLGLRTILDEWSGLRGRFVDLMLVAFAVMLVIGGLRAVAVIAL